MGSGRGAGAQRTSSPSPPAVPRSGQAREMDEATHTTPEGIDGEEIEPGWRLVRIVQLVTDLRALGERLHALLEDFTPEELHAAGTAELDPARRAAMVNEVCALRDAAEEIGWLGGDFVPLDHPLHVELAAVADAAADLLASGSGNVAMVQLAARLLLRARGFPALARGLEEDAQAAASWGETTIAEVLESFRDGSEDATAWVCASACLDRDKTWATLEAAELARLAWALRNAPAR